jgi:hypothetical protein
MRKKAPRAAVLWMAGDRLFSTGLLLTMAFVALAFYVYSSWGWGDYAAWSAALLVVSVGIAALGIYLKRESYKLALRAGIDVTRLT